MGNRIPTLTLKLRLSLLYFLLFAIVPSPIQSQQTTTPSAIVSTDPSYYYNLCVPSVCSNFTLPYPFALPTPCHSSLVEYFCPDNQSFYMSSPRITDKFKILSLDSSEPGTTLLTIAAEGLFTCGAQISRPNYVNDATIFSLHSNYTFGTHFNCTSPIPANSIPGLQNASCLGCEGQDPSNFCYYHSGFVAAPSYCEKFHIFTPGVTFSASSVSNLRKFLQTGFKIKYTKSKECRGCEASGGRCGSHPLSGDYLCFCPSSVHSTNCTDGVLLDLSTWANTTGRGASRPSTVAIAAISSSCFIVILVAVVSLVIIYVRRQNISQGIDKDTISGISPTRYTYSQLKKFTNNFSVKIGEGGFGSVYKGMIHQSGSELPVAVKMLKQSKQTKKQFMNEVGTIGSIHHHNLVSLVGYCVQGKTHALVYEFMENGSLDKYIYKTEKETEEVQCETVSCFKQLSSKEVFSIALGTARGILYLHSGCSTKILHCDIKPPNVLLDSNFSARVADFGLARMIDKDRSHVSLTTVQGTPGYTAPEMWLKNFGLVTEKSDVYSYGMLLLEIIGRRKNYDGEASGTSQVYFPEWLYKQIDQADFSLLTREMGNGDSCEEILQEDEEVLRRMCLVGLWCIQHVPSRRPSMDNVIQMLEGHVEIDMPPYPFP